MVVENISKYENAKEGTGLERPKLDKGKRKLSEPPTLTVQRASDEDLGRPATASKLDKGKRVMSMPPPTVVIQRASDEFARPVPAPKLDKGKRVMSMPPGATANLASIRQDMRPMVRGRRVLKVPPKLAGERTRVRWSDVPSSWRHGTIDPLRCHSVDQLPPPDWQ